jgi:hypothetical protein
MSPQPWRRRLAWLLLAVNAASILAFGAIVALLPTSDLELRSVGVASIALGVFGLAIAWWPFRRGEHWAWLVSWVYPLFWLVHLAAGLPPGTDHVHQVVLGVAALVALGLTARRAEPT